MCETEESFSIVKSGLTPLTSGTVTRGREAWSSDPAFCVLLATEPCDGISMYNSAARGVGLGGSGVTTLAYLCLYSHTLCILIKCLII